MERYPLVALPNGGTVRIVHSVQECPPIGRYGEHATAASVPRRAPARDAGRFHVRASGRRTPGGSPAGGRGPGRRTGRVNPPPVAGRGKGTRRPPRGREHVLGGLRLFSWRALPAPSLARPPGRSGTPPWCISRHRHPQNLRPRWPVSVLLPTDKYRTPSRGGDSMSVLVRHAMTEAPKTASPSMNAADAAALMKQFDVGVVPVAEGDQLLGLVTDRDLVVRVLAERKDPTDVRLSDVLTKSPITVSPDTKLSEARDLMAEHKIRRLPVTKADRLVGILSLGDVALADASERAVGSALEDISESTSTTEVSDQPPRGTPDRVTEARG